MPRRVPLGPARNLHEGSFVPVPVIPPFDAPGARGVRGAIVGRRGGRLLAYANLCRHHAVPLDLATDGDVMDARRVHLLCHHHGAVYDAVTGLCIQGPCVGARLIPLGIVERAGEIELVLEDPSARSDSHE